MSERSVWILRSQRLDLTFHPWLYLAFAFDSIQVPRSIRMVRDLVSDPMGSGFIVFARDEGSDFGRAG